MKNHKELIKIFKDGMKLAADRLGKEPNELKRDDYVRHVVDNNIPRLNKMQINALGGFKVLRDTVFPVTKSQLAKERAAERELERQKKEEERLKGEKKIRDFILNSYIDMAGDAGFTPTMDSLADEGITSTLINKHFGAKENLHEEAVQLAPHVFDSFINEDSYDDEQKGKVQAAVRNHKRFVITSAVAGKPVDSGFLASIETYLEENDAALMILPCEDVASRNSMFRWELDPRLKDHNVVFEDVYLNRKILLSSIMVSAKQINPLTGLDRLAQRKGSMILASPKQDLKFVANSNIKLPKALMTTGAITLPDYTTDLAMSKRTSYLAEFDHTMGAIVVEIVDDKYFHFRQLQCGDEGEIIDLGWVYKSDGSIEEVEESLCTFGDTHVGVHDVDVDVALQEITDYVNCKEIIVHDLFDGRFNNHHDKGKVVTRAKLAMEDKITMVKEGQMVAEFLDAWAERVENITIVKSNHDEVLDRYIEDGRWKDDPINLYDACELVRKSIEGEDLLEHLITQMSGLQSGDQVKWLERDEDYKVYQAELSAHGDLGANGSRGSLMSIEKAYYKATVGHSHTAGILRNVYQVGTSSLLKLSYNRGPSSWTQTMCIEYPNGARQLVNVMKIDGVPTWKLED